MTIRDEMRSSLDEAIASTQARIRAQAAQAAPRLLLAELLVLAGALQRADLQLDAAARLDARSAGWITIFRRLLRGEMSRREVFEAGRAPELLTQPDDTIAAALRLADRTADSTAIAERLAAVETAAPSLSGACDERPFEGFRDLNDATAHTLEAINGSGVYYWIPFAAITRIDMPAAPERLRDLIWRQARVTLRDGTSGELYLPALYPGSHESTRPNAVRIGEATEWEERAGGLVAGAGQRTFLVGEEDRALLEISSLGFSA